MKSPGHLMATLRDKLDLGRDDGDKEEQPPERPTKKQVDKHERGDRDRDGVHGAGRHTNHPHSELLLPPDTKNYDIYGTLFKRRGGMGRILGWKPRLFTLYKGEERGKGCQRVPAR